MTRKCETVNGMRNLLKLIILSCVHNVFCDAEDSQDDTLSKPPVCRI